MQDIKHIRQKAFTLAEILITLMIIGFLALVTIPAIYTIVEKSILSTSFKRGYNILYNLSYQLLSEEPFQDWNGRGYDRIEFELMQVYAKKLRGAQYLAASSVKGVDYLGSKAFIIMPDLNLQILSYDKTCKNSGYAHGVNNQCLFFAIDTNGTKNPNKGGYDRFIFVLSKRPNGNIELVPEGFDGGAPISCTSANGGPNWAFQCDATARALKESDYFYKLP